MQAAFHVFCCILLMMIGAIVPGAICAAVPVGLLALSFGVGRKSVQGDVRVPEATGPPSDLPWLMLSYTASFFLGSVVGLGWLIFAVRLR